MKWSIDILFNKFTTFFKFFFYLSLTFFLSLLNTVFTYFSSIFIIIYNYLNFLIDPLKPFFKSFFIFIADSFLFIFFTLPLWFYGEFFKPLFFKFFNFISYFLTKYIPFSGFIFFIFNNLLVIITVFFSNLYKLYILFWKKIINFLFFNVWRNKNIIFDKFQVLKSLFTYILFIYIFLYNGLWLLIHNYIFSDNLDNFIYWNLSSYLGYYYLFISLLNLDNLFLIFYIIFIKVGLNNFLFLSQQEYLLLVGSTWVDFYLTFKVSDVNFTFFRYFLDSVINILFDYSFNGSFNFNDNPIFFYFGCLFFFTVIVSWFFFSYLGLYGVYKLNIITLFMFWVSLLFSAKSIFVNQKIYIIKLCSWAFLSLNVRIDYYFLIDTISFSFMLLTTTIAFFVFIYAFSYFRYEPLVDRFLLFILSFVISMIFLVTSGNTIMLFLGWELIGFTSFCLINFWTTKTATLKSAFKAFTFNKVSDFYMFMFLVATYSVYYTFDILSLNNQVYKYEPLIISIFGTPINYLEFVALMIIGAAFIKSAQFGGHAWLPDSMEAPVPASSLIHSATLVSAGVYLILRFNFIFDLTQFSKFLIPVIGSLTAAYGGVCAVAQSDIKKTLAYSTISHCGFLMVLCATEMNEFTILYLYVHGFFKAGVFMCVGNVLRITRGYQDTRRMGGLLKYLPFEYFCATVGVLNLAGLPFTFGFFIKHLLLISLDNHMYIYYFVIFHSLVGAFAGLFYSYRLITFTFGDFKKGNKVLYLNLSRSSYNSIFYSNSSLAATLSIFFLFVFSYIITYFMFKYFMNSNYLFSDYMNTTILTNYYSVVNSYTGYLLNFSYINLTVVFIFLSLYFSKYRKIQRYYLIFKAILSLIISFLFLFLFYMFI